MRTRLCLGTGTGARVGVLAAVALVAFALKRHYADAGADALSWVLAPTARLAGLIAATSFTAVPGEGYFSVDRLFLIEKACAGVNFMIAAFVMVALTVLHRVRSLRSGVAVVGVSLLASYIAAVIVNSVRIAIAMWLAAHQVRLGSLTAADVHRLEGVVVYFGGLLLLFGLVQRIGRLASATRPARGGRGAPVARYALPLGCYYLITLVVPIANGVVRFGEALLTHALVVLSVPLLLIVLARLVEFPVIRVSRTRGATVPPAHPAATTPFCQSALSTALSRPSR